MKKSFLLLFVFVVILSACKPGFLFPAGPTTVQNPLAILGSSFLPTTYKDMDGKLSFNYPQDWILLPEERIGDRGTETLILSPGSTAEAVADGGSRIALIRYNWDPKNDLSAWTAQRKSAWDASGMKILDESTRELKDGRVVVDLLMQTADNRQVVYSLTTIGDRYLEISAEGDVILCKEILGTLQSIE
jgi:hypothetical protein